MASGMDLADMRLLREEAGLIQDLITRLKAQLNRLKIEEMHIQSKIREDKIRSATDSIPSADPLVVDTDVNLDDDQVNNAKLNLNVDLSKFIDELPSAEEEEEDDDDDDDDNSNINDNAAEIQNYKEALLFFNDSGAT